MFASILFIFYSYCRQQQQLTYLLEDSYNRRLQCIYIPASKEEEFLKIVDLQHKADFLYLNTSNNIYFIEKVANYLERKGKVLVEVDELQTIQPFILRQFNVLFKTNRIMMFSN